MMNKLEVAKARAYSAADQRLAAAQQRSASWVMRDLIRSALRRRGVPPTPPSSEGQASAWRSRRHDAADAVCRTESQHVFGQRESRAAMTTPWERIGISRGTWFRRGKPDPEEVSERTRPGTGKRGHLLLQSNTWLKNLSDELHRPMSDLIALSSACDPFNVEVPGRKRYAEWFAELYRQHGFGLGTHIRRIHYG
jgi:hypothetical protein